MKSAFESTRITRIFHIFPCLSIVFVSTRNLCSHRPTAGLNLLRLQLSQLPLVATHRLHLPLANQVWIPVPLSEHAERGAVASFVLDNVSGSLIDWFTELNMIIRIVWILFLFIANRYNGTTTSYLIEPLPSWPCEQRSPIGANQVHEVVRNLTSRGEVYKLPRQQQVSMRQTIPPIPGHLFCQNGLIERWEAFSALLSQDLGQIIWECPWADSVKRHIWKSKAVENQIAVEINEVICTYVYIYKYIYIHYRW